jgi:hypothetical protein
VAVCAFAAAKQATTKIPIGPPGTTIPQRMKSLLTHPKMRTRWRSAKANGHRFVIFLKYAQRRFAAEELVKSNGGQA